MRYHHINKIDIANGPGFRVSLFTQGCGNKCPGCFNPDTHDLSGGLPYDETTQSKILSALSAPGIVGLSILGGEPLLTRNLKEIADLCSKTKKLYPTHTIWIWTGFYWDQINHPMLNGIFEYIDVFVCGPYEQELHDIHLKYAGSSNQYLMVKTDKGWIKQSL